MLLFQVANPDVNLTLILPELIVAIAGVIVMIVDAFSSPRQRLVTGTLSLLSMLAAATATIWLWVARPSRPLHLTA